MRTLLILGSVLFGIGMGSLIILTVLLGVFWITGLSLIMVKTGLFLSAGIAGSGIVMSTISSLFIFRSLR